MMKKISCLVGGAIMLVSGSAIAFDNNTAMLICDEMGNYAKWAMQSRQSGASLAAALDQAAKTHVDPLFKKVTLEIILSAYGEPIYIEKQHQNEVTADFKNKTHLLCVREILKQDLR